VFEGDDLKCVRKGPRVIGDTQSLWQSGGWGREEKEYAIVIFKTFCPLK